MSTLAALSCGFNDAPSSDQRACVEGQVSVCTCDDGSLGSESCGPGGTYEPCQCEGGPGAASNGNAGNPGTSDGMSSTPPGSEPGSAGDSSGPGGSSGSNAAAGEGGSSGSSGGDGGSSGGSGASTGGAGTSGTGGSGGTGGTGGAGGTGGTGGACSNCQVCTPGQVICTMASGLYVVSRCNDEGTGFENDPCAPNQYCDAGSCHTQACLPNAFSCSENVLRRCNERGSGFTVVQTCADGQRCDATAKACLPTCKPDGCTCMAGFSPCCMNSGACGCALLGSGACSAGLMTGADRCVCD